MRTTMLLAGLLIGAAVVLSRPQPQVAEAAVPGAIPIKAASGSIAGPEWRTPPLPGPPRAAPISSAELDAVHDYYTKRFVEADGFGKGRMLYVGTRKKVVRIAQAHYRVEQVELIGLMMHSEPVVYVVRSMRDPFPSTHRLLKKAMIKKRMLTAFEKEALAKARRGGTLMLGPANGVEIRMVGALRNGSKECAACHDSDPGTLLGGLSYRLVRVPAGTAQQQLAR